MKIEEALNYADEWTNGHTFYEGMQGWRVVCAVLAAEVRRLRVPAAEAVPLGYALANLDGTIRNHGDGELMVYRNPFSRSDKTDCIPLYMHPPSLDVRNMQYMGNSVGYIYQKMEAYRHQLGQAQRQALDAETRKLINVLLSELDYAMFEFADTEQRIRKLKNEVREKLGAGDE